METSVGLPQELFSDGQVYRCGIGVHMTQKRGQEDQPAVRVDALTVPAQQGADGKGVPLMPTSA